jgi:hypothetical protein
MKNKTLLGLLALAMIASVSFAHPTDYDMFVKTGGALRYVGSEDQLSLVVFPQAHPDEYREVDMTQYWNMLHVDAPAQDCPRENGLPVCR